jgi:hypothetical protein
MSHSKLAQDENMRSVPRARLLSRFRSLLPAIFLNGRVRSDFTLDKGDRLSKCFSLDHILFFLFTFLSLAFVSLIFVSLALAY